MRSWMRRYWPILVLGSTVLLLVVSFFVFLRYGGSGLPTSVLAANSDTTYGSAPSPECRAKQAAEAVVAAPIKQQMQAVLDKTNKYALELSSLVPVGTTDSLDDMAAKVSPAYKQQVSDLESQYSVLSLQLQGVEGQGWCR